MLIPPMFQFLLQQPDASAEIQTTGAGSLWPVYLIIGFVALTIGLIALRRLTRSLRRPELLGLTRERIKETWEGIVTTSGQGLMGAKLGVMEADKLLDNVLKSMYFPGETMAERLKVAAYKYPGVQKVWWAHKLRNQLVHDAAFEITTSQARSALKEYEAAFKSLNVM